MKVNIVARVWSPVAHCGGVRRVRVADKLVVCEKLSKNKGVVGVKSGVASE